MKLKPEEQIQSAIVDLWNVCGRTDVKLFHVPNELARTKSIRIVQAQIGLWAGCPDLVFLPPAFEPVCFLEVKAGRGSERPDQLAAADLVTELGHRIRTVRSLGEAENALAFWNLLRRDTIVMERCA